MPNTTARKFGHPATKVAETEHWLVLVRPQQPTFGSLVLVCKDPASAFSEITPAAYSDLGRAVAGIEALLRARVNYQRINYLMLMMVDPDVHFHVIPRYEGERVYADKIFPDAGWPGPPNLGAHVALDEADAAALAADFARGWAS